MCFRCHQEFTDEQILEQISSDKNSFELWNETSMSHLYIAYMGFNGRECSDIARKKLDSYIEWEQAQPAIQPVAQIDSCCESQQSGVQEFTASFLQSFLGRPSAESVKAEIAKFTPIRDHILANNLTKDQILEYLDSLDREGIEEWEPEQINEMMWEKLPL